MKFRCLFRRRPEREEPTVADRLNAFSDAVIERAQENRKKIEQTKQRLGLANGGPDPHA